MDWNSLAPEDCVTIAPQVAFEVGLCHHHIANTAYPINHNWTMNAYRVRRSDFEAITAAAWQAVPTLGLYVHIPFCQARCNFCEYTVINPADNARAEDGYFELLLREMDLYRRLLDTPDKTLTGFDIGGGTPALAKTQHIEAVIRAAKSMFRWQPGLEISIETTPLIAAGQPEKIAAFYQMGIRRISMGVQVTQLSLAQKLGRQYKGFANLRQAVANIRAAGFQKFNIDLMYGFAGQSVGDWQDSLRKAIELEADYITLYQMRYKGTGLQAQANEVSLATINQMKTVARQILLQAGYEANPGKNTFSRLPGDPGTSDYLTRRVVRGEPYLGLGLGAQSFTSHTLAYNRGAGPKRIEPYADVLQAGRLPLQDLYYLSRPASMAKMIAVSFYFGEVNLIHFREKYDVALEEQFAAEVHFALAEGLLAYHGNCLSLTERGAKQANGVIALFYAPAVKRHLLQRPVDVNIQLSAQIQRALRRQVEGQRIKGEG